MLRLLARPVRSSPQAQGRSPRKTDRARRPGLEPLEGRALLTTLLGLTDQNTLLAFDSSAPATILGTTAFTGLTTGESIIGIDVRPSTGTLLGLGNQSHLYTINASTGAASLVSPTAFSPSLVGSNFGFDVNPVTDKLRIADDSGQNLRLDPSTGAVVGNDALLNYAVGDPHNGTSPNVVAISHTNNLANAAATTLYGLDSTLAQLVRIGSLTGAPNSPDSGQVITVGPLGVNVKDPIGFDILGVGNSAYAAMTPTSSTSPQLYTIDLTSGHATSVGTIGGGTQHVIALAASTSTLSGPIAPSAPTLSTASDSGSSNTDHITNIASPLIQGQASPNSNVQILANGIVVGQTVADASGTYSLKIGPLADGTYAVQAIQYNASNVASQPSSALSPSLVILTAAPKAPGTPMLFSSDDTGFSNSDNFTRINTPRIYGTGTPGDLVTVYVNGAPVALGDVASFGQYGVQTPALADGSYQVTATQTDVAGNVSPQSAPMTPALVIDNSTRPSPALAYLGRLYQDLLGRPADQQGLDNWAPLLAGANGRYLVVQGILGSEEYRRNVVNQTYQSLLHRPADPQGLIGGVNYLATHSTQGLQAILAGSPEYFALNGGTNDAFVGALYRDLLGRAADPGGKSYSVSLLNSGAASRSSIATLLLTSPEGYAVETKTLYTKLLHITPDATTVANMQNVFRMGSRNEDIIGYLVSTDLYYSNARDSDAVVTQFVSQVYKDLLGRPADPAGLATLTTQLDGGTPPIQVVRFLQNTDEYRARLATQVYNDVFRRNPEPAGLAAAVSYLNAGGTIAGLRAYFYATPEYYNVEGGGTNAGFVSSLYQDVLGRPADPAGAAAAIQALNNGLSRNAFAAFLLNTTEGAQQTIQAIYLRNLRRVPTFAELTTNANLLQSGSIREQDLIATIVSSSEYFSRL